MPAKSKGTTQTAVAQRPCREISSEGIHRILVALNATFERVNSHLERQNAELFHIIRDLRKARGITLPDKPKRPALKIVAGAKNAKKRP